MAAELLTALDVRNAKPQDKPYKLRDGKGLFLEVRPSGLKVWRYRYRIAPGKPDQMFTIGEAGEARGQITLAGARNERVKLRDLVKRGIHPREEREGRKAQRVREGENTFTAIAEEWIAETRASWTPKYYKQVRRGMDQDILPAIGKRPIASITAADVRHVIRTRKAHPSAAAMLRLWIGSTIRWALANGIDGVTNDPTLATRNMIKRPAVEHHKPLKPAEIPTFLDAVRSYTGQRSTAIAAEILLFTFVRPGELCGARWDEFNMEEALWIVPAARMKMREDHYVPLSPRVLELLTELRSLSGNRQHLFPNRRDPTRPMHNSTLNLLFESIGFAPKVTPHSMRGTASTILNGMGYNRDWIERQLSHKERDAVRASYNSAEYLPQRRQMMDAYAARILSKPTDSNVVQLHATEAAA